MQGAEAAVLDMVACGWGVATLDTVPVGIALPLREAAQRCRHSPPSGALQASRGSGSGLGTIPFVSFRCRSGAEATSKPETTERV